MVLPRPLEDLSLTPAHVSPIASIVAPSASASSSSSSSSSVCALVVAVHYGSQAINRKKDVVPQALSLADGMSAVDGGAMGVAPNCVGWSP